jgi:hypothetical protein
MTAVFLLGLVIGVGYMFGYHELDPQNFIYISLVCSIVSMLAYMLFISILYLVFHFSTPKDIETYDGILDLLENGSCNGSLMCEVGAVIGILLPFVVMFMSGIVVGMSPVTLLSVAVIAIVYTVKKSSRSLVVR